MSLQFNDTTNFKGIVQIYEKECGFEQGDISGNTNKLKAFTADANLAHDEFLDIGFKNSTKWQFDDSSTYQSDGVTERGYPIIKTNLVSGQRDYGFLTDQRGNLILNIYRVMVADSNGVFYDLNPKDQQTPDNSNSWTDPFVDGQNITGKPTAYDKTSNGIFLDYPTNYDLENGLKVFIDREGSYFVYTDTTKMPGVPGLFHKWYAIRPALDVARRNNKSRDNYNRLFAEVEKMRGDIADFFGRRERDVKGAMRPARQNNK